MANPKVPHFSRLVNNGVVTQYCTIKWKTQTGADTLKIILGIWPIVITQFHRFGLMDCAENCVLSTP